jgi:hypothetical protein
MSLNRSLGTATLAPILISFSHSVVSDQCSTFYDSAAVRTKLARL